MESMLADSPRAMVLEFIEEFWGRTGPLADDADLFDALGISGDDASEFMERFVARFGIEVEGYRWYFHHGEEGWSVGSLFFKPPDKRVARIPITVALLTEAVRTRCWPVEYPDHALPRRRWDILINQIFGGACLAGLAAWGWMTVFGR